MKPFSCNYCKFSTNYKENLNRHLKIHNTTVIKPFTCTVCNYSSNNKCNFIRHLKRIHNKTIIKQFACNYCEFSTEFKYNLNQHLKKVHQAQLYLSVVRDPFYQWQISTRVLGGITWSSCTCYTNARSMLTNIWSYMKSMLERSCETTRNSWMRRHWYMSTFCWEIF